MKKIELNLARLHAWRVETHKVDFLYVKYLPFGINRSVNLSGFKASDESLKIKTKQIFKTRPKVSLGERIKS